MTGWPQSEIDRLKALGDAPRRLGVALHESGLSVAVERELAERKRYARELFWQSLVVVAVVLMFTALAAWTVRDVGVLP